MKETEKEQNPVRFGGQEVLNGEPSSLHTKIKEKETTVYGGFSKRYCAVNQSETQLIHTEKSHEVHLEKGLRSSKCIVDIYCRVWFLILYLVFIISYFVYFNVIES